MKSLHCVQSKLFSIQVAIISTGAQKLYTYIADSYNMQVTELIFVQHIL